MQHAITLNEDVNGRLIFAQIYRLQGKLVEAKAQLRQAKKIDTSKIWTKEIAIEQRNIDNMMPSEKKTNHEN